jgi:hypothetical protein
MKRSETHCNEELELLGLLKELQHILTAALDSLANQKPSSPEARYVGDAAKSVLWQHQDTIEPW